MLKGAGGKKACSILQDTKARHLYKKACLEDSMVSE